MRLLPRSFHTGVLLLLVVAVSCGAGIGIGRAGLPALGGDTVAVVYVEGTLQGGEGDGLLGGATARGDQIIGWLRKVEEDPSVKAVVLRVDSPGGAVTTSDEIHNAVRKLKGRKPVVASFGNLAASGGYYISAPASRIVANPTSLTGSIGVITVVPNIQGLLEKMGVETYVFTSGPHKDESAGLRPLTDADRAVFQGVVDEAFQRFLTVVSEGRGMSIEQVRAHADGRVLTGSQAMQAGLVDALGDLPLAIRIAGGLAGIAEEPRTVSFRRGSGIFSGLGGVLGVDARLPFISGLIGGGQPAPSMQYLYIAP